MNCLHFGTPPIFTAQSLVLCIVVFLLLLVCCPVYPLASEVVKGYSNATVRPSVIPSLRPSFRNILVNTLESASFNGF
jgi:hypothetical protein